MYARNMPVYFSMVNAGHFMYLHFGLFGQTIGKSHFWLCESLMGLFVSLVIFEWQK